MPHSLRALTCALGLSCVALAQRPLFTVGGASPDYPDLPAAVAAVPPGSVLAVRPGAYTGFATGKPLQLALQGGSTGVVIVAPNGAMHAITITALPAGEPFVIVGQGSTIGAGSVGCLRITGTAAPVLLGGLNLVATGARPALDVQYAGSVHARNCVLAGGPGLSATVANVVLGECVLLGTGAGAVIDRSVVEITRTFLTGTGQPALRAFDSDVRIASDGSTTMGVVGAGTFAISPIEAWSSRLQFAASRLGLQPANGAPPVSTFASLLAADDVPVLTASPAPLGSTASARLVSNTTRPGMLVLGNLLATPVPFLFGGVHVDTVVSPLVVALGSCGPSGLTATASIPPITAVLGTVLCLQGVVWQPSGLPVLSAPALWLVL